MATRRTAKKSGRTMTTRRRDPASQNDIYEILKRSGAELDHHESDLYVRATPETIRLTRGQPNISYFISNGQRWIELPFRYTPFWKAKRRQGMTPNRRDPSKVANLGAFREKKQAERRAEVSRQQQEYEHREVMSFLNDLRAVEKAPLRERKEDAQTFTEILHSNPEFVAESVGHILSGNFGRGAYVKAQQVAHSPRMNQAAALVQWAAALEWRVPQKMAIAAWKTLSQAQRKHLDALVKREIKDNLEA